jgi:hypothetical protein
MASTRKENKTDTAPPNRLSWSVDRQGVIANAADAHQKKEEDDLFDVDVSTGMFDSKTAAEIFYVLKSGAGCDLRAAAIQEVLAFLEITVCRHAFAVSF